MKKRKKDREFRFFWEKPDEKSDFDKPMEFRFTIPRPKFPELRIEKTVPLTMGETDKEIIIKAELPGFRKEDINLKVTENFVDISAAKKEEKIERAERHYKHEKLAGTVRRAFPLPEKIKPDKVNAKLEDGLLTVVLTKSSIKKRKADLK